MIREWFETYRCADRESARAALREILQEVALAGLYRAGFFEKAAFYGGTSLRILHGLDRFSEDMDFTLLQPDPAFSLVPFLSSVVSECEALGLHVTARVKDKPPGNPIESAFLKSDTLWSELVMTDIVPQAGMGMMPAVRIKLEVDRNPPLGFHTEERLLTRPFSFHVKTLSLPDLFAGKMHALLFRKWGNRVKGRDWYDMEWYIRKGVPLHLGHFEQRARDSGNWTGSALTSEVLLSILHRRIQEVSYKAIRDDLERFIRHPSALDIWSAAYFTELSSCMTFR